MCDLQATPATPCSPGAARTFTTVAGGTFILDSDLLPNTSYTVWASIGGATPKQGSQTLTIAADGTGALLAIAIAT